MTARTTEEMSALLDELLAEREVLRLLARYANLVDYGDASACALLFTEDGYFELQGGARNRISPNAPFPYPKDYLLGCGGRPTEKGFRFEGYEGVHGFMAGLARERLRLHAVLQPVVRLGDGEAWVESQMIALGKDAEQDHRLLAFGRYFDHLIRVDDGAWRFKSRLCEL
ncbi:nuclear transport factor 2 family protein [Novosphingobium sp. fls2-241-R2A-195]|uniref:nuclear transport factor 2 family protein n=1 Tax=Novosphingobium sp. fls2-241-R2A-195 TaxID=3040296 RepID=UPI002550AD1D|nr:nuclear transport factor 2 family protein [Novosphingobium sp. fls2-241-R2A-195]